MIRKACLIMSLVWCAPLAWTEEDVEAAQTAIHKALDQRWYEIEVVIFERLRVLDFNSPESLVIEKAAHVAGQPLRAIASQLKR